MPVDPKHWTVNTGGIHAFLLAAGVATLTPEARKGFIKACVESYCGGCGHERKECKCRHCAYGRCEALLKDDEAGPYCNACQSSFKHD